ncbi:MAG: nucleotidyltransferase domain-containing protein [Nanoarchaeota archaeon]|nr:nucleotidyltransferase domain-containing protein [Nanoarchaeota archaeon]
MKRLTKNEKRALVVLFREPFSYYNANSLGKKISVSRVGTMKLLRNLEKDKILKSKIIGKSVVYNLDLEEDYVRSLISFLLAEEANNFKRWKEEFKEIFKENRIVILFGSVIVNYSRANDIDLIVIADKENFKDINKKINEKRNVLPKEIHLINISPEDFLVNLEKEQKTTIEIMRTGIVLYGQNKFVEIVKDGR